jgi:hypothetical protein
MIFRKIVKSYYFIRHVMPVYPPACNNSAINGRILIKFDIWKFFENLSKKIEVSLKSDKNNEYFTCMCAFMVVSR